jgi:cytochrome c biogenesis protein CcmG/thiol:disulfide interchange protein DsbE
VEPAAAPDTFTAMKGWTRFLLLASLVVGGAEAARRLSAPPAGAREGDRAPELALLDLEGRRVELSALRGRVVILNFWATWCAPCKAEIPDLAAVYAANRGRCLELLGVSADSGGRDEVAAAARELGIDYPVLLDDEYAAGDAFRVVGLPRTVVVDAGGRIRKVFEGQVARPQLEAAVAPLLAEAPACRPAL